MECGHLLVLYLLLTGLIILLLAMVSLAKKKMSETFCLIWGLLALVAIVMAILINPREIERYISREGIILILLAMTGVICAAWIASIQISILARRNRELAMQVSMLNQENEQIMRAIRRLTAEVEREDRGNEENTVRNQHDGIWRSGKGHAVSASKTSEGEV